jgi:hypothetical protein
VFFESECGVRVAAAWHLPWRHPCFSDYANNPPLEDGLSSKFTETTEIYFFIRSFVVVKTYSWECQDGSHLSIIISAIINCVVPSVSNRMPAVEMSLFVWSQIKDGRMDGCDQH